ncbi:MAG: helix-turn-helix domain-containing protein [Actinobacteria bacterium]|nr:helix-turn-helix domain-containing protein [Actinomycetota bacterium]
MPRVTWYTWLEQGRQVDASRSFLDALARALLLDVAQHEHLLLLAAPGSEIPAWCASSRSPTMTVRHGWRCRALPPDDWHRRRRCAASVYCVEGWRVPLDREGRALCVGCGQWWASSSSRRCSRRWTPGRRRRRGQGQRHRGRPAGRARSRRFSHK